MYSPEGWPPWTFLARLGPVAAAELLRLGRVRTVGPGEHLTLQGEQSSDVYLLRTGKPGSAACVKVFAVTRNGAEALLAIRMAGDVIGEGAVLRGGPRVATATACTQIVVHAVQQQQFLAYLDRRPFAWRVLGQMLADRLHWSNQRRLDFTGYDVRVRLARIMLELVESHGVHTRLGVELGVQISQEEFGKLIGARPDAIGVAMRSLRAEGLVTSRYRGVRITDVHALRRLAEV